MPLLNYHINAISGIWNSYGCVPTDDTVKIQLEENTFGDYSLMDICGFTTEAQNIGKIADSKEISELIVLLPMIKEYFPEEIPQEKEVTLVDPCEPCPEDPCKDNKKNEEPQEKKRIGMYWSPTEWAWLFTISEDLINKILGVKDYKMYPIRDIKDILEHKENINKENNIVKLMMNMVNYNFPPHLNWLLHKNIPPLVIYTQEFKSTLNQQDLADIWQGVMPTIGTDPQEDQFVIEHFMHQEEMFAGFDLIKLLDLEQNTKLKIFKVKKRAKNSYIKDVVKNDVIDLKEYTKEEKSYSVDYKWYNYNWPYDNFSLVELLKVEFGGIRDYVYESSSAGINPGGVLISGSENYASPNDYKEPPRYNYKDPRSESKKRRDEYVAENTSYTPGLYE